MRSAVVLLFVAAIACQRAPAPDLLNSGVWIDLSYDFSPDTIFWPTAKRFELQIESAGRTPAGYYYAANNLFTSEHGGTHLDAPLHFAEGKWATDQIPLERLVGPAVVVDVTNHAANPDYQITPDALEAWERANGPIPDGAIVLFRTGWGRHWPDPVKYLGTARTGPEAVAELHFPGIHPETARWLTARGTIDAIGIDTASIDYGQSSTFDTHQILFAANIPAFENVAQLDRLPARGSVVVALPMKIKGGSGGPLRIVAVVPRDAF
ncbi:MAG: cyclase family protein [Acidobacteria bacterium]|nr:MAG: cyclase family protein [Acidobacteriota bacterium]